MSQVLEEAQRLLAAGMSVVPLRLDGTKAPKVKWSKYAATPAAAEQVRWWFQHGKAGIGVIGGKPSGGLEAFDFDRHTDDAPDLFSTWVEALPDCLLRKLVIYASPGRGFRACYRCAEYQPGAKLVLARDTNGHALIELLGRCINVVPGGHLRTHSTGKPYSYLHGHLAEVATITPDERALLVDVAVSLNLYHAPARAASSIAWTPPPDHDAGSDWHPWQDYNQRGNWDDILKPLGWAEVETGKWKRPDKSEGISATTDYYPGFFYLFSSSVPGMEPNKGYTKTATLALLHFGGDFSAANEELANQGYGKASLSLEQLERMAFGETPPNN